MIRTLIYAATVPVGEEYARAHGLDRRDVVTPRSLARARGCVYDRLVIVPTDGELPPVDDRVRASIAPCFNRSKLPEAAAALRMLDVASHPTLGS